MLGGPMAVFSYIVGCEQEKECLIIDPAGSIDSILSRTAELGLTVKYVVNTHGHADHTGGNSALISRTGAKLVAHEKPSRGMSPVVPETLGHNSLQITMASVRMSFMLCTVPETYVPVLQKLAKAKTPVRMSCSLELYMVPVRILCFPHSQKSKTCTYKSPKLEL